MYTVSHLANIAGVSTRTLQYYDSIGLLKPAFVGENGYRYYDEGSVLNLQQILFYRELELSLKEIKEVIRDPSFEILEALKKQKMDIGIRIGRLKLISETIDKTIISLNGGEKMSDKQMFSAFTEKEQEKYALEAENMYDPELVRSSNKRWKNYNDKEKKDILKEGNIIYADMVSLLPEDPHSKNVQAVVERWRKHMDYFWTPSLTQLKGIAENYSINPGFRKNFDKIHQDLAVFFGEAVKIYVERFSD
jgi:MerR family transcriptional regulator, thiopeptide resistance regulator